MQLMFASWGNEGDSVVLNVNAGDTLLVTREAALVLQALQQRALSISELLDSLKVYLGSRTEREAYRDSMRQLLTGLNQQGLVERADA